MFVVRSFPHYASISYNRQALVIGTTYPPLKAPTGFFTGTATASCLNTALVWNAREALAMGIRHAAPARAACLKS